MPSTIGSGFFRRGARLPFLRQQLRCYKRIRRRARRVGGRRGTLLIRAAEVAIYHLYVTRWPGDVRRALDAPVYRLPGYLNRALAREDPTSPHLRCLSALRFVRHIHIRWSYYETLNRPIIAH